MSLQNARMPKLIDKLEQKKVLEEELGKVEDEVAELQEPKKVKIKKPNKA